MTVPLSVPVGVLPKLFIFLLNMGSLVCLANGAALPDTLQNKQTKLYNLFFGIDQLGGGSGLETKIISVKVRISLLAID